MISLSSYTQYYQSIYNTENFYQYSFVDITIVRQLVDMFTAQRYNPTNTTPTFSGGLVNRTPNNTTTGAIQIPPIISGGTLKLLATYQYPATVSDFSMICDRLLDTGNISTSATTAQTINLSGLTRYTAGTGVFAFMSASATTSFNTVPCQISYTNQDGISNRVTTFPFPQEQNNTTTGFLNLIPLVSGDTGMRSIDTLQFLGTANAANTRSVYICMFKLIASTSHGMITNNLSRTAQNFINGNLVGGIPNVASDACLFKIRGGMQGVAGFTIGPEMGNLVIKEVYDV